MTGSQVPEARRRGLRGDMIVATLLAAILSVGWAITDWPQLSRLLLPDPDDMMRLAQVRDLIAGQAINDWTQYRMAPPIGAPMHWSRVNDVGLVAIILAVKPIVGQYHAELTAVLLYPTLLLTGAMFLSARIARRLWGVQAGPIAAVLTGLAYPGTTIFIPGRIDHHALQAVLTQLFVLTLMRVPTTRTGVAAGAIMAISLVVGLETAPQVIALLAVLVFGWVAGGAGERARLGGFACGLAAVTLTFFAFLRPGLWTASLCDAFTPASVTAAMASAAALAALAAIQPVLRTPRHRLGTAVVLGSAVLAITLIAYPSCISGPYGEMDPFLRTAFLPYIDEANGLFAQPRLPRILAIAGVVTMACVVAAWMVVRAGQPWRTTMPIAAVVWISELVMLYQVRGAYIGAPLGAPVLAGLILVARTRASWRLPAVIAAWLASAGLAYLEIPKRIGAPASSGATGEPTKPQVACSGGDTWRQVDRFPAGVVMAGTSIAAYVIGATHHATVGAGYHRNNTGNMAMYRFFLSPPDTSLAVARQWRVDYVLFCPGDFDEIQVNRNFPASLAAALRANRAPAWLQPLPLSGTSLRVYRIVRQTPLS